MQSPSAVRNVKTARPALLAAATVVLAFGGLLASLGVIASNSEKIIGSAFEAALRSVHPYGPTIAASAPPLRERTARFDGISAGEAFWLGLSNPGVVSSGTPERSLIGLPLTWRAAAGDQTRHLVIVDVRELAPGALHHAVVADKASPDRTASAVASPGLDDETRIDVGSASSDRPSAAFLIVCRDIGNPDRGEVRFTLRDGEIEFAGADASAVL